MQKSMTRTASLYNSLACDTLLLIKGRQAMDAQRFLLGLVVPEVSDVASELETVFPLPCYMCRKAILDVCRKAANAAKGPARFLGKTAG